jgi:hypothetical protein
MSKKKEKADILTTTNIAEDVLINTKALRENDFIVI